MAITNRSSNDFICFIFYSIVINEGSSIYYYANARKIQSDEQARPNKKEQTTEEMLTPTMSGAPNENE